MIRHMPGKTVLGLCVMPTLLLALAPLNLPAASWPPPRLEITLPFSRGNGVDMLATLQAETLRRLYGVEVVLKHLPGRSGANAWASLNPALADGSAITAVELPGLLLRATQKGSGINLAALRICHISSKNPLALWVPLNSPIVDLASFTEVARAEGGNMQVAGPGTFSAAELAALRLDRLLGIQTIYSPYMGSLEAATALKNDPRIKALWADALAYPSLIQEFRLIAVADKDRAAPFPQTPTFRELGYDLVRANYKGYVIASATPKPLIEAVYRTFEALRTTQEVYAVAGKAGFTLPEFTLEELPGAVAEIGNEALEEAVNLDILPRPSLP